MITGDKGNLIRNFEYIRYMKQDSLLASWLLSSINTGLLSQIIGCNTSQEIWAIIEQIFNAQSSARIMHYKRELQSIRKEDMSKRDYLTKIKNLCNKLSAVGHKISDSEQGLVITNGLDQEYES